MMTGTLPDFPEGIEKIVREVRHEIKAGKHFGRAEDQDEDGAQEIMDRIKSRKTPKRLGLDPSERKPIDAMENLRACDWAGNQYFKILLTDLRRFPEFFLDHQKCGPHDC